MKPTLLICDDSIHSYELRHEVGEVVFDPIVFVEHEGRRMVVVSIYDRDVFLRRRDVVDEVLLFEDLGADELATDPTLVPALVRPEIAARLLARLDVAKVNVPPTMAIEVVDHLRHRGIEVDVSRDLWTARRRMKTGWEMEGLLRAQEAADAAMTTVSALLRRAHVSNDHMLMLDGRILTAEMVRQSMQEQLLDHGCESEHILVHCGDACLSVHELGSGPLLSDTTIIVDCFPRDRSTGMHADMTRTYVVGRPSDRVADLYSDCRRAREIALSAIRPGRADAFAQVCDFFESKGHPTIRSHSAEGPLTEGFFHHLGHGVGLQIHEDPRLGPRSPELVEGDVVTVEPGLYYRGVGGVRLEDTVIVGRDGPRYLTEPLPHDPAP